MTTNPTPDVSALVAEARDCVDCPHEYTGSATDNIIIALADALEAANARVGETGDHLQRYRAVTHWIGADSWDGCSDCMNLLRWAAALDDGRDMTQDEIAAITSQYRSDETCRKDGNPCYTGAGTDDAHWRCGSTQCGNARAPAPSPIAAWRALDDNGLAELTVNGKRITSFPSYPAAQEAAERINAALIHPTPEQRP